MASPGKGSPQRTIGGVEAPSSPDWVALSAVPLPIADALEWVVTPSCGAAVSFIGTVRDHAEGRSGVGSLTYEAYEELAHPKMVEVAAEMRRRWPDVGRVALLHRTGELAVGDVAVAVVVSTPHRAEAFAAAAYGIDAVKATVPIWKREQWAGGSDWGTDAAPLRDAADVS